MGARGPGRWAFGLLLAAIMVFASSASAASSTQAGTGSGDVPPPLASRLQQLAQDNYGSYGIYLSVVETGEQTGYCEDEVFYAASLYKLFLVMYIYESAARGKIDLNRPVTYQAEDMEGEGGVIQDSPLGTSFTTRELCRYAIVHSDNVAARILKRVYGYRAFRDYAASIGCPIAGAYNTNSTTAREMGILLMRVLEFAAVNPLGEEVVGFLEESVFKSRIPAGLPDGVRVGNKTGDYQGCRNDAAVIFLDDLTYVFCVLSREGSDSVHAEASRLAYEDIYRRYYAGGGSATRSCQPSTQWTFARVPTQESFEAWLSLVNGEESEAAVSVKAAGAPGDDPETTFQVPPRSTLTLRANQFFPSGEELALSVSSNIPVLAEKAIYYRHGEGWEPAGSRAGAAQACREWCFAGKDSLGGFDTWLYLFNPGPAAANCAVTALGEGGRTARMPVLVPPGGRASICLNDLAGSDRGAAASVLADAPVLAETVAYRR